MTLSDLPIYRLRDISIRNGIDLEGLKTKPEIAKKIEKELPESILLELLKEYMYAGRTGVVLFKYSPSDKTEIFINRKNLPEILKKLCEDEDPFQIDRKPEITEIPQIVSAKYLSDNKAWILFVKKGIDRKIYVDYDRKEISTSDFINTFFHMNDGIFEIRTNYQDAKIVADSFFYQLNKNKSHIHNYWQIMIDLKTFKQLREKLNAITDEFLGKDYEPGTIYDTKKFTRSRSCPDLWGENRFHKDIITLDPRKYVLIFKTPLFPNIIVKATVSIKQGSIYFRTFSSETDIQYVHNTLINLLELEGDYAREYLH